MDTVSHKAAIKLLSDGFVESLGLTYVLEKVYMKCGRLDTPKRGLTCTSRKPSLIDGP